MPPETASLPKPPIPARPAASGPAIASVLKDRLRALYLERVRPHLKGHRDPVLHDADACRRQFAEWRTVLPSDLHGVLIQLEEACETRRQIDRQRRLHGLLHGWLLLHIPISIALFVLLAVHVVTALRVIPF